MFRGFNIGRFLASALAGTLLLVWYASTVYPPEPGQPPPEPPEVFEPPPEDTREYESVDDIPQLFHPQSGEALVRYCGNPEGDVELYGAAVRVSPRTGRPCEPLTQEVLEAIRSAQRSREARRLAEEEQRQRKEARRVVEEAEEAFKERHLDVAAAAALRGTGSFVLLAVDSPSLESRVATALRARGATVRTGVVQPSIFEAELFGQLTRGDARLLERLGLADLSGHLLLGRLKLEPAQRANLGNVVNRRGYLTVSIVPLDGGSAVTLPPLAEVGAGFDETQAQAATEERLVEALLERGELHRIVG